MGWRLRTRNRQPERMDQPNVDPQEHRQALLALERINGWSLTSRILWPALRDLAKASPSPIRVLDLGCGGGDVLLSLWKRANRAKLPMIFVGFDMSPTAIGYARERAASLKRDVAFEVCDVLQADLPNDFDVVTCSLFLHHLSESDAQELLGRMAKVTRRLVLVNDLSRSILGYWLAYFGTRVLSRSSLAHYDGPISVEGAFTPEEALLLAEKAGLVGANVRRCWPCRYLLEWSRP